MTWGKTSDDLYDHPKVLALAESELGPAMGLWVLAHSWCSKHLTNGAVPERIVKRLGSKKRFALALVRVGLWEKTADGFQFHDWLDYNPSATEELAKRQANRERVTRHRQQKKHVSNAQCNALQERYVTPVKRSCNTPPVPEPVPEPTHSSECVTRAREPDRPTLGSVLDAVNAARQSCGLDPLLLPSALDRIALHALSEWGGDVGRAFVGYCERATVWERRHDYPLQVFARNPGQYLKAPPNQSQRGPVPVSSAEQFAREAANNPEWAREA